MNSLLDVVAEPGNFLDEVETSRLGLGELERYPTDILAVILYPPDDVIIADGQVIAPENDGQADLGTLSNKFGAVYTEDVRTDTITATDYVIALGGLHVGGTGDPGTDNLIVDLDTRIGGGLYVGSTGTDPDVGQLFLDQGAGDYNIVEMISSDVAHGMTDLVATDVYGFLGKTAADLGGLQVAGVTESEIALYLGAYYTTADTGKDAGAEAACMIHVREKSGAGTGLPSADANLFAIRKGENLAVFIIDEDGDLYRDGSENAFDKYDDAKLCRAFDLAMSPKAVVETEFDRFIEYNRETLRELGILGQKESDTFYNITALQRLHNGAIWQLHTKLKEQERELAHLRQVLIDQGIKPVALQV